MRNARGLRRSILLALSLLSGCAASNVPPRGAASDAAAPALHVGAAGAFLTGRFAATQNDMGFASDEFLRALGKDPASATLRQQAFLTTLLDGRPEAVRLARQQPDNPAALLLLGGNAVAAGNWDAAESRFAALPKQGLTQLLQPLLVAWSQQGQGHTDTAIATLQPYIEGQRFRAVYALHAAAIADLANRTAEAARLYRTAETEFGGPNLELSRLLASWHARQGHSTEAAQAIRALVEGSPDLAIAQSAMLAHVGQREIRRPADGIAEAYLALAFALHAQDANEFAAVLVRLALDLRSDFTAARLLSAELAEAGNHPGLALAALSPVGPDDPLFPVVQLRRTVLYDKMGNTEEALRVLDEMARSYPSRPEPLVVKGDILRSKRRFSDAVTAY
ncbi:MAG: hypothetical protein JO326_09845, partial [Acetobacteraceae bacterium]|nr:hypothetical protein [Acetobacteraceae bacterium]